MAINPQPQKKRGKGIVHVSDLFKRYRDILRAPEGSVITACIEVVQDVLGVTVTKAQCSYTPSTRTLSLTMSGMLKTEILLRKEDILGAMREKLGERNAPTNII